MEEDRKVGVSQDELIIQQHREIEKEISDKIPLVGSKENLGCLIHEYKNDEIYQNKVKNLCGKYDSFRRTRPDGNCFFRAFAFAYLEQLLDKKEEYESFRELAKRSKEKLIALSFPKFTLEDFHDVFMEVVNKVGKGQESANELYKMFNDQGYSDYVVVYLRLIASAHLQEKTDFYQNFIEGNRTVVDFCRQEVEPMYKESDHIHIIALSSALNVGVRVRYMDRGGVSEVIAHDFPEGCEDPIVHLLYRPGHYDILYPLAQLPQT
ncbi:ubiquitin thioesterase otubain-like isoform X2 [Cimex lectularius]|uniref:ubiquitinyl hydrolase 1 n=1 Tax=Cimex lectularius TaxID=79782 RepID=A0A8I6TH67_CIMLE|nr:ubiquitin thioesterase otubain-like isoform X2 [Cimex lectularius]XP_014259394.1 ubiquitin thioesterase otubain-like isoform X2 [Cimex lectularius]